MTQTVQISRPPSAAYVLCLLPGSHLNRARGVGAYAWPSTSRDCQRAQATPSGPLHAEVHRRCSASRQRRLQHSLNPKSIGREQLFLFRQLAQCVSLVDADPQPSRSFLSKLEGILDIPLSHNNAAIACSALEAKLLSASTPTCTLNAAAEPFIPFRGPTQLLVPILEEPFIQPESHFDINYDDFQVRLTEHEIGPVSTWSHLYLAASLLLSLLIRPLWRIAFLLLRVP